MTDKKEKIIRRTEALCPVCGRRLSASYVERGGCVYLRRDCPDHGEFAVPVWRNHLSFESWVKGAGILVPGENPACPSGCGLCPDHRQATCCVLLPVTSRCNLSCRHCFADPDQSGDPPFERVESGLKELAVPGQTLVQLSGGEPTLREDLPEIVAAARRAGCRYVQLNTNGIRLAEDKNLAKKLADEGLSFVFLQFDGIDDGVYNTLRGRPLFEIKRRAIENCAARNIGVTLVPTMVPGVNTDAAGAIIRFAVDHSPAVRGVHFQPLSYFGRSPLRPESGPRYTLDELLRDIGDQSGGLAREEDFSPSRCDHPLCGMHGDFVVMSGGVLKALGRRRSGEQASCRGPDAAAGDARNTAAAKNRNFVGRRWERPPVNACCCVDAEPELPSEVPDMTDMEQFAVRVKSHGFTISAMAFQDAATLDIDRLRQCSLHVFENGKHIPFCAYYL